MVPLKFERDCIWSALLARKACDSKTPLPYAPLSGVLKTGLSTYSPIVVDVDGCQSVAEVGAHLENIIADITVQPSSGILE